MRILMCACAFVAFAAYAQDDLTWLKRRCQDAEQDKMRLENNAPKPVTTYRPGLPPMVFSRPDDDPELVQWRTKLTKANAEIAGFKDKIFKLEIAQKKQQIIVDTPAETKRPSAHPTDLQVRTITLTDGTACDVVKYMRTNDTVSGVTFEGIRTEFKLWNVQTVTLNETYHYRDRPQNEESIRTYRQLMQTKQKAVTALNEVQRRIAQQQTMLDGYQAAIEAAATRTSLDGRAEAQTNIAALRIEEKPLTVALNDANADIKTFADMQMYCALCEGSEPAARITELNRSLIDPKPIKHEVTEEARDSDREARMNAVIERERLARQRLTKSGGLK